jgi:hypothetical protein
MLQTAFDTDGVQQLLYDPEARIVKQTPELITETTTRRVEICRPSSVQENRGTLISSRPHIPAMFILGLPSTRCVESMS